jgi:signal transduction histidine kinase
LNPRRSWLRCFLGSLVLALLALWPLGPIRVFELATLDLRFRVRERWWPSERPPVVRSVLLDDASLAAFAHWPVPLSQYASAVTALSGAQPRVLGMDVFLAPADSSRPREERDYHRLLAAVGAAPRTVLATHAPVAGAPPAAPRPASSEANAYPWTCDTTAVLPEIRVSTEELPAQALATAATRLGFVQFPRDEDGVVRRVPLVLRAGGDCYPSFVLQLVCLRDGVLPHEVRFRAHAVELWRGGKLLRHIPVDEDGCLLVNYHKHPAGSDVSLAAVVRSDNAAVLAPLRDQVVLLGTSARALGRVQATPLAPQMADAHILGEAVETILNGHFLWPTARPVQFFINWAFLMVGALLMVRLTPWRGVVVGLGLMVLYFFLEKTLFIARGVWLDFIGPMAAMQMAVVGFPLYSYRSRGRKMLEEMAGLRRLDDSILSTMTSGLLLLDGAGRVVKANPRAAHLLGRDGDSLDGQPWRAIFDTNESALAALEQALAPGSAAGGAASALPRHVPVVLESGAGDRLLDLSVSSLGAAANGAAHAQDGTGEPRWLLTFTDVTEHMRLMQEDERRARLAAIGEIAARLGHEIRNSLGGLRLYVENVREEIDPQSPAVRTIDSMVEEIEGLYRKIDALREYGRDPNLDLSDCDLKQVVDEALTYADQKLRDKHLQVFIEAEPRLSTLRGDRRQLRDAFQNLIQNAAEAAPFGGALRIGITRADGTNGGPAGHFVLHFEDNGPGIPDEVQDQVFSLFFTTKPDIGTGLGLPLVKKIVESHGGRISFESEPGHTCFTVMLPPEVRGEEKFS